MIEVWIEDESLTLKSAKGYLKPSQQSQLAFWGFTVSLDGRQFSLECESLSKQTLKLTSYLERVGKNYTLSDELSRLLEEGQAAKKELAEFKTRGLAFKNGAYPNELISDLQTFLDTSIPRKLRDHQFKATLHLLTVKNGANFSVPGSGKTTVVLTAFAYLRQLGQVDALFVVGPPSCFGPWKAEYEEALGITPTCEIFAGGDIDDRSSRYAVNKHNVADLNLTSFQTLHRDWPKVTTLFKHQDIRFFFVIDEAHYIKQVGGAWAEAALNVSACATRRCILTGTPFPRSYSDAFNLFDSLCPNSPPISDRQKNQIEFHTQKGELNEASNILDESVAPLFYRVRKQDLGLAPQRFHDPIEVEMNRYEKLVYDSIIDRVRNISGEDYLKNIDLLSRLRRGRIIRLRQCTSYTSLLGTALDDYEEDLVEDNLAISDIIYHYDKLEKPAKLEALLHLVNDIRKTSPKIVIWSNFVSSLHLIQNTLIGEGIDSRVIYGGTPLESESVEEHKSREGIIRNFIDASSGIDVLIANPAACSESISLHKTCAHSIYYDMSYNCAQYLQSLDRIHRVGGSENKEAHYYFLQYANSLDQDIITNVMGKAKRMADIVDQEYPIYSLDMWSQEEEIEAYDRIFGAK